MSSILATPAATRIAQIRSAMGQRSIPVRSSFADQLDAARRPDVETPSTYVVGSDAAPSRAEGPATATPPAVDSLAVDAVAVDPTVPFAELFDAIGPKYDIQPALLAAVAQVESAFDPAAVSPVGAQGLMQFMPATAAEMGVDPFDPASAVDGAARYLRRELDRFGSLDLALAAYNAGPGAVQRHGGVPPFPETQRYVVRVLEALESHS